MADISIIVNSKGNYTLQEGQLLNGNELLTKMYTLLVGSFNIYYPEIRSPLKEYLSGATGGVSITSIRSIILNAWSPLLQDGSISNLQIQINVLAANKLAILANCLDNTGQTVRFVWQNYGTN